MYFLEHIHAPQSQVCAKKHLGQAKYKRQYCSSLVRTLRICTTQLFGAAEWVYVKGLPLFTYAASIKVEPFLSIHVLLNTVTIDKQETHYTISIYRASLASGPNMQSNAHLPFLLEYAPHMNDRKIHQTHEQNTPWIESSKDEGLQNSLCYWVCQYKYLPEHETLQIVTYIL